MFDFANILLSGKCNASCSFCIGRQIDQRLNRDNLGEYPPRNLDRFIELVRKERVRQVVVTGTNTDPQLYRYEGRLLEDLRRALPEETQISLHTNGRMALRKMAVVNQYDRVTISLPSFEPWTYRKMMGVGGVPDMYKIMRFSNVSIKISCVICDDNRNEMGNFLESCQELGVQRIVLRKMYGEKRPWRELLAPGLEHDQLHDAGIGMIKTILEKAGERQYRGNPVVELPGMQLTLWDFQQTQSTSLNLFSNGLISDRYLLAQAGSFQHSANSDNSEKPANSVCDLR